MFLSFIMIKKSLIIYNFINLYEILYEIKNNLDFNLIELNDTTLANFDKEKFQTSLVISSKNYQKISNIMVLKDTPIKLQKLLEIINIYFLRNEFLNQSEIKVGKYTINKNSRELYLKDKKLSLTEREINLLIYINLNKKTSLKELQKNVWGFVSEIETHTVETHIYRLRKKINDFFSDNDFIVFENDGYLIK